MSKTQRRVVFISNGHGEDMMAAKLAYQLRDHAPELSVSALPVVGLGNAYQNTGIPLLMPGTNMPSGGFIRNGFRNLMMDLRAGLFGLTGQQIRALKTIRRETDLAVCVGDVSILLLAAWFLKRPIVFLPTAKSDYIAHHWLIEVLLIKKYSVKVFPRDSVTADSLKRHGVPAEFLGNVMMDCLEFNGDDLRGRENDWTVAILPGGRTEAYENMKDIGKAVLEFSGIIKDGPDKKAARFLVALSGGLAFDSLAEIMAPEGWKSQTAGESERDRGILGYLSYKEPPRSAVTLTITQGRFGDVLRSCDAVIGMAGTANEQAVGLGKPVVTFVGRGTQFTEKFVKIQKKLLGDSLSVVSKEPKAVAKDLISLLTDDHRRAIVARVGNERMGRPGGADKIVEEIIKIID